MIQYDHLFNVSYSHQFVDTLTPIYFFKLQ